MPDNKKKATQLMKSSMAKKQAASTQERLGKAQIKAKTKAGSMGTDFGWGGKEGKAIPVGQQRLDMAKKLRTEATRDSLKAVKLYPGIAPKKKK